MLIQHQAVVLEGKHLSPPLSGLLVAELIIKLAQDGVTGGKLILINLYGGLMENGPKKWSRQATFVLFRQRTNIFVRN